MKKNKDMLCGFVLGVLLAALVAAIPVVGAAASKRTIDVVYNDIKLVIDGKEVTPLDGNGQVVEPFIYNGTTYLPLRAVANALTNGTKPVSWDQSTYTIYIGERPVDTTKTVNMLDMKTYPQGLTVFEAGQTFTVRQKSYTPFNTFRNAYNGSIFLLNGDYTELNGLIALPDGTGSESVQSYFSFIDADTDKELLRVDAKMAEDPVEVSVNVTGVDKLKILTGGIRPYFFNATLTPISKG